MTEIPITPTPAQKLEVAALVIGLLASYDGTSIWSDDRDDAACAMLRVALYARNYLKSPSEHTADLLSIEIL